MEPCYYRNSKYQLLLPQDAEKLPVPSSLEYNKHTNKWEVSLDGIPLGTYPCSLYATVAYHFARSVHPNGWDARDAGESWRTERTDESGYNEDDTYDIFEYVREHQE